MTMDATQQR